MDSSHISSIVIVNVGLITDEITDEQSQTGGVVVSFILLFPSLFCQSHLPHNSKTKQTIFLKTF